MKKLIPVFALAIATLSAGAQEVKKEIKKDANAVGNKTAEVASKTASTVTDQVYKDKVGPNGEKIYIDNHSKYYYVDKKGHHQYITKAQMKPKQEK